MKNKLLILVGLISALGAFVGCQQTPAQAAATALYASGQATAFDILQKDSTQIATIQDVAAKLPQLNSGKLTPYDMGVLGGELHVLVNDTTLLRNLIPADSDKLDKANAFLAGVIQSNASLNGGSAPTASQVLATTALTDFANGLAAGVEYWKGRDAVGHGVPTNP